MNTLKLHTAGGMLDVMYKIEDFIPHIPNYTMEGENIVIPKLHVQKGTSVSFEEISGINSISYGGRQAPVVTSEVYKLDKYQRIITDYMSTIAGDKHKAFGENIIRGINEFKKSELLSIILNTPFNSFHNEITVEKIEKLVNIGLRNGHSGDKFGVHITISETQQLFSILDPNDFKFYYNVSDALHMEDRACYEHRIRGKLVNLKDNNILTFRYFEGNIMYEMSNHRQYTSLKHSGVITNVGYS